ncbi:hypothetical protein GUJ93_ZPchr0008g11708 [Zizania palustris]|uniref:Uncharacterized protein n=1 Tax=Zizania palustris TaxID=103762 RepID=A0A8J5VGJ7_ZIZPA|nr:hypothetical protein GUJ93_ZPchr0008g11708 [Zizania palustris]
MVQGAFPADVGQDDEPHVDHILDEPVEADAAWEGWPVQQAPAPQADHPQVATVYVWINSGYALFPLPSASRILALGTLLLIRDPLP